MLPNSYPLIFYNIGFVADYTAHQFAYIAQAPNKPAVT